MQIETAVLTLWPLGRRSDRTGGPVESAHALAHLAATFEKSQVCGSRFGHTCLQ